MRPMFADCANSATRSPIPTRMRYNNRFSACTYMYRYIIDLLTFPDLTPMTSVCKMKVQNLSSTVLTDEMLCQLLYLWLQTFRPSLPQKEAKTKYSRTFKQGLLHKYRSIMSMENRQSYPIALVPCYCLLITNFMNLKLYPSYLPLLQRSTRWNQSLERMKTSWSL